MDFNKDDWIGPEDLVGDISTLRQIKENLTQLQGLDGKIFLDKLLERRYNGIMAGIAMAPLPNLDAALAQEYEKGRAIECIYQMGLIENLIAVYTEQIETLQQQQNEEEFYGGE